MTLLLCAIGVTLGLSGDYLFKMNQRLPLAVLLYAAAGFPIWCSYRLGTWMQVAFYWTVMSVLASGAIGVFFFHESLTARQWVAFGLAVAAVWTWNS